jgi:site-specific DNA-methyltransferase (adenine-specific)
MNLFYAEPPALTLYHGDARRLDALADGSVQMIICSPPYFNARPEYSTWPTYKDYLNDMALAWAECWRVLCDGGRIAVNVPMGYGRSNGYIRIGDDTARALEFVGFTLRGHIIWDKSPAGLGTAWGTVYSANNPALRDVHEIIIVAHKGRAGRGWPPEADTAESARVYDDITPAEFLEATASIWQIPPVRSWHPAPMPPKIPYLLTRLYTYRGDTVLDPFCGSATVPYVAQSLGRNGIGVDLNADYLERAAGPLFARVEA